MRLFPHLVFLCVFATTFSLKAIANINIKAGKTLMYYLEDSLPPKLPLEIEQFIEEEVTLEVPIITCQELYGIQENGYPKILLLDARSQAAYNVSHIPKARRVGYNDFSIERVWFLDTNLLVVIYCGQGQKSEKIALELQKIGFDNIRNLYGSINEWARQDLPLVNKKGKRTRKIYRPQKIH